MATKDPHGDEHVVDGGDALPVDLRSALARENLDRLLLDVQGAGMMLKDPSEEGELALAPPLPAPSGDPQRFDALRAVLGVGATDRPTPLRVAPVAVALTPRTPTPPPPSAPSPVAVHPPDPPVVGAPPVPARPIAARDPARVSWPALALLGLIAALAVAGLALAALSR